MRDGMEMLLLLLRGGACDPGTDDAALAAMLALADEERVLPWAAARLRAGGAAMQPAIAARLDEIERLAALEAFFWCSQLKGLLHAFDKAGVEVVPLKGPFLAERLYGAPALRACRDIDLLVAASDLSRADDVLRDAEFAAGEADDYHRPWRRHSTVVELHHDVENPLAFNFHTESALGRARPALFCGERCLVLRPEDELLFLCLHAARHRFERLSLVLDLQLAFERVPNPRMWSPRPQVCRLGSLLVLGHAMARRLKPGPQFAAPVSISPRQTRHLDRLAGKLWQRLMNRPAQPLDWRRAHAFYAEMEATVWARVRRRTGDARILMTRVIGPDYAFAARFGLRRTWQARLLRPLRLLSEIAISMARTA